MLKFFRTGGPGEINKSVNCPFCMCLVREKDMNLLPQFG